MIEAIAGIIIAIVAMVQAVLLKRMDTKVKSVDRAVNCVAPGEPRLVDKVDRLLVESAVIKERLSGVFHRLETLETQHKEIQRQWPK